MGHDERPLAPAWLEGHGGRGEVLTRPAAPRSLPISKPPGCRRRPKSLRLCHSGQPTNSGHEARGVGANSGSRVRGDGAVAAGVLVAVAMANRLCAPLSEEVARKARGARAR